MRDIVLVRGEKRELRRAVKYPLPPYPKQRRAKALSASPPAESVDSANVPATGFPGLLGAAQRRTGNRQSHGRARRALRKTRISVTFICGRIASTASSVTTTAKRLRPTLITCPPGPTLQTEMPGNPKANFDISFEVRQRPAALDPRRISEFDQANKVMPLAQVDHDPDGVRLVSLR